MSDKIKIVYNNGKELYVDKNTKIIDIVKLLPPQIKTRVVGSKIDNAIVSMDTKLKRDTVINFIDSNDLAGYKMYQAGLKFVFLAAVYDIFGKEIGVSFDHSIMRGMHITINGLQITNKEIIRIKERMTKIISDDLRILKMNVLSKEMVEFYKKENKIPNCYNVLNIDDALVTLYKLENYFDYFYVEMPYSTGCLSRFDLVALNDSEVVLLFPTPRSKNEVPSYVHYEKVIECFKNEKNWLKSLDIPYVYQVNKVVASGKIKDLIRLSEINYDNKIHEVATKILERNSKFVMIAGPSSSGKTTTSKKLSLFLSSLGVNAIPLSLDDFFLNRDETPLDEFGNKDYESINSLDLKLFNKVLDDLLNGKSTHLPTYNFITGEKEISDKDTILSEKDCLVIEGLHGLNPALISDEYKSMIYKIYISPLTPLNVDRHNYVSTTENRLLRRIIRDFRTRGKSGEDSLASWNSVRRGEEKYIFPYTDDADAVLNTAYAYEIGVLKVYVEPILYSIDLNSEYYSEARRILDHLKTFYSIPSEYVSEDNLLREFIGGSSFE